MRITYLGHAGLFLETENGSILCDPWFNPAYFGSWWPFPANDHIDLERIAHPTYLYISHLHQDHYDAEFLREVVDKSTTVLLPNYPVTALKEALMGLGFTDFRTLPDGEVTPLQGRLKVAIWPLTAPADGPLGDSYLFVDDGETKLVNLNDARPRNLDDVRDLGPIDVLFLQFSGAIWYPMVYDVDDETMAQLGRSKRQSEMHRAETFIRMVDARHVFPSAGPPCFLDEDLFQWNDLYNDETNTFPDQTVFLQKLKADGIDTGHLALPGTDIVVTPQTLTIAHHFPESVEDVFNDKESYLRRYQARTHERLAAEKARWPEPGPDFFTELKDFLEPVMALADLTARQIKASIVLDWGEGAAELNFLRRRILPWDGSPARYYFRMESKVLAACVTWRLVDWVNSLFLSMRFRARRDGEYNEAVYTFFKCLSPDRIQFAEGYWIETHADKELWQCGDYMVQRRCPHMKADLRRFASVDNHGILTCHMHGWQFELATGRCLNADDRVLYTRPVEGADKEL
ncbi:Rieske 2Fe-2S domain-containing protein [Sulfobacillus harzensis]|uniref:MBL fold metallo-hydrolase n=1 Tax=Sulfobacillus harzensis TaxID=2729629 RepID=A0A7Y0Q3F1_9FIRM|nr:Rieske 2Fe-2S domain-containing protein [Sulfobacillus harzensis]NMP23330.1 MBL fold metallo-hydrolase [Sulfobacillus harzensis]